MKYKLNKTDYDSNSGNFEPIPEGEYLLQIMDFKERETKNGDPMIGVQLEVVDGDHAGRFVFHNVILYKPTSPGIKGMGMTRHFLHCIGEPYEGDIDVDTDNWIPRQVRAEVFHEEYNGKTNARIGKFILDETLFGGNPGGAKTAADVKWDE
jgi:hypothetical protein